jgi:HAD superfamily hydrolase (TIGR01549 family)
MTNPVNAHFRHTSRTEISKPEKLVGIKAVVFDVYGTLVEIGEKRRPFGKLMDLMRESGREPEKQDVARLMCYPLDLAGAVRMFGVELSASALAALEQDLHTELASIKVFPDALWALTSLREAGYRIGLCSNLALPYAAPVKMLLPFELDAYVWSFEVGSVKPDAAIYESACAALEVLPHETLMIGDTPEADYHGPRRTGLQAIHLSRKGDSRIHEHATSLNDILGRLS